MIAQRPTFRAGPPDTGRLRQAHQRRGWWDLGHRIVASLAESRLTPHTREAVRDILDGQSLADASVWADNIRQYRHDADKLHYVNIPLADTRYVPERHCPGGQCIIAAIEQERHLLADPAASREERAEALRFLIHFMGDLHQPLHVGDNGDRGGNQRAVTFLGHATDLHKVWDGELIDSSVGNQAEYLESLRRRMELARPQSPRGRHRRGLGDGGPPDRGGARLPAASRWADRPSVCAGQPADHRPRADRRGSAAREGAQRGAGELPARRQPGRIIAAGRLRGPRGGGACG